jgi:hypothetical protein
LVGSASIVMTISVFELLCTRFTAGFAARQGNIILLKRVPLRQNWLAV